MKKANPLKADFRLGVTWFYPERGSAEYAVAGVRDLKRLVSQYRRRSRLVWMLDREEMTRGGVWAFFTGDRAWVVHFTEPGGIDSYPCDRQFSGQGHELIGFLLENGQEDFIHPFWTVSRDEAFQALTYFGEAGERDPSLEWITHPDSLQEPPPPGSM